MLHCNLQVFFCTEIAVEKHFDPRNVTSGGASGPQKNLSFRMGVALCAVIVISLLNFVYRRFYV